MRSNPLFWLGAIFFGGVAVLAAGTIAANRLNQSAEWYAGFGQWIGAFSTMLAAGLALWIATVDRRRADSLRSEERSEREADLLREAGLVRIADVKNRGRIDFDDEFLAPLDSTDLALTVRNFRTDRIFELELKVFSCTAEEVEPSQVAAYPTGHADSQMEPAKCSIAPDGELFLTARLGSRVEQARVVVRYTDQNGRRWEVDSEGDVSRVTTDS